MASAVPAARRVAIVGGGPSGLTSCRFLALAGQHPTIFEAGAEVGGIWSPEPTNPVVYPGLVTNIPTVAMQSFDLDFRPGLPSYVTARDLGQYVEDYATHFGLRRFLRLNSRVLSVRPLRTEEEEAKEGPAWKVRWAQAGEEVETDETFDAVVVATGHYEAPYRPSIPGEAEWLAAAPGGTRRTVEHARRYRGPQPYAGRSVLVVGGRSSGVDLARELRGTARWVYVLESGCSQVTSVGNCTHVPVGARLRQDGAVLLDEQVVPGAFVDDILLATGYVYDFPFLDAAELGLEFGEHRRYVAPLYLHVAHVRRPSLLFAGLPLAVPAPIPLLEAQGQLVAALVGARGPGLAEREAWLARRREEVAKRPQDLHFLGGSAWDHILEIIRASGLRKEPYQAFCRRLAIVAAIYKDRCDRAPKMPWDDDTYRQCEYQVNWATGAWRVCPLPGQDWIEMPSPLQDVAGQLSASL